MLNKLFFIILCFRLVLVVNGQKYDLEKMSQIRNVTVVTPDSVIKTKALDKPKKFKVQLNTDYYWYYNNQVACNTGGYSGKLLTGKYQVLTPQNLLITEGQFENGVMQGLWKYWHPNGKFKCLAPFKEGRLHGVVNFFDSNGLSIRKIEYKSGLKHGKEYLYLSDTTIINKYSKGKLIVKPAKKEKKNRPNAQTKKSKKENTTPKNNLQNTDIEQSKTKWWKRVFKPKKEATKSSSDNNQK